MRKHVRAKHVVVISIDGLLPAYHLDPTWPAPSLEKITMVTLFRAEEPIPKAKGCHLRVWESSWVALLT